MPHGQRRGFERRISTHAPLAGRDGIKDIVAVICYDFNPRAPCGARLHLGDRLRRNAGDFNPRAPCGARPSPASSSAWWSYFNPRAPCGARLIFAMCPLPCACISTHAPLAGRDPGLARSILFLHISTHAPLAGRDRYSVSTASEPSLFQPTRPLRGATGDGYLLPYTPPRFQPTRPLRGATAVFPQPSSLQRISTHAPLAGRDVGAVKLA